MCHIETWSTRYCMRTAEKVWRSKVKKKNMVCQVSKEDRRRHSAKGRRRVLLCDTRQTLSLPSVIL